MQKSAHSAVIATRLNNLEQKFDELDEGENLTEIDLLIRRLAKMTIEGSQISGSIYEPWETLQYHFDDVGFSMSRAIFGDGTGYAHRYNHVKFIHNLWWLIFDDFIDDEMGNSTTVPSVYGRVFGRDFVKKFGFSFADSLSETIFGNPENLDDFRSGGLGNFVNSLYDAIKLHKEEIYNPLVFYEFNGENRIDTKRSGLRALCRDSESRIRGLEDYVEDLRIRVAYLEERR